MRFLLFLYFLYFSITILVVHARSSTLDKVESQYKGNEKVKSVVLRDEEEISVSLAKYIASLSYKFTKERGAFTVVLSGGTIITSLRYLTEQPYLNSVDWSRWYVFWVDERVVSKNHSDSNYKGAYDGFLSKVPIPTSNIFAINDTLTAEGAAKDYEKRMKHLVEIGVVSTSKASGFPKFDLMLLGMGEDGHVASLFQGHPQILDNTNWVTYIMNSPKPPPQRITFTFPVINSSEFVFMYVLGVDKADPVTTAICVKHGKVTYPVQMVSPQGELTWFLDLEAASKLPPDRCGSRL